MTGTNASAPRRQILGNPRWAVRWTKTIANIPLRALVAFLEKHIDAILRNASGKIPRAW